MLYPEEEDMPSIETELTLLDGAAYRSRSPSQSSNDSSSDVVMLGELESSDDVDQKYEEVENLFRQISGWQSIKEQCKKYSSIKESEWSKLMCRLEVYVEYSHLCNVSREFALRAVYEYRDVCYIFEDVIYSKIFNQDLMKRSIYRDQLHVVLRIGQHSPEMPILEFDSLEVAAEKQLQFYHGYVRAISLPKKYVRSTRYVCQNRICGSGYYQRVVHTFDKEDITNLMHACIYCNNLMEEDTSHRIFGKAALLDVRDLTLLYDVTDQDGPALLCCRDELIPQIEQEKKYIFTCIPASSTGDRKQVLEVICVSKITRYCFKPLSSDSLSILRRITHGNPAENENVFSASSWETVFYITNIFGKSIAPGNAYFGIKLVLLLSMAQCASDMVMLVSQLCEKYFPNLYDVNR